MANIVIFGGGDIAQLAYYYFIKDSEHTVVAFTVDKEYVITNNFIGLPVIAFEKVDMEYSPEKFKMFIAVSYAQMNRLRAERYYKAKEKGYDLVSYISSRATVFDNVEIGDNCFILEDNTLQPFSRIGNDVTLWSGNHIGHHASIGDHCFISSHAVISGGVNVGEYSFIGVNATVRDHITIARETVVGAGCLILKDTKEKEVFKGLSSEPHRIPSNKLKGI